VKTLILISAAIALLLALAGPVMAQGDAGQQTPPDSTIEKAPGAGGFSVGLGIDWGGIGVNYLAMGEGSDVGLTIGVGTLIAGFGGSAGIAVRSGETDAVFAEGFVGGVAVGDIGAVGGGVALEFGNLPFGGGELLYRIGLVFSNGDNPIIPIAGFGLSL